MEIELPIGKRYGCITIIDGLVAYHRERVVEIEKAKQKFINGERSTEYPFDSLETFDRKIQNTKSYKKYKCK